MPFTPDRRPFYCLFCTSGNEDDPLGLTRNPSYITDGINYILDGWRSSQYQKFARFLLHMPQGHPSGQEFFCHSNWRILPETLRNDLLSLSPAILYNWEIFTGFEAYLDNSFLMPAERRTLDLSSPSDYAFWQSNWSNWLSSINLRYIWFDSASGFPTQLTALATQLSTLYPLVTLGGEAFPITAAGAGGGPGGIVYNLSARINDAPWMASLSFYRSFSSAAPIPWAVNPSTTECHVVVQFTNENSVTSTDPDVTQPELNAIADAGFIVSCAEGCTDEEFAMAHAANAQAD